MLGLYRVLEELTREFSHVLFESCSGGGGRFDPGMLHYMPQTWTSDDTDAYERLFIQYGTSFAYPPITMAAHVSVSPNHQVGRTTPLKTRALVSMMANLGYELDLSLLSQGDKEQVIQQIAFYKDIRKDIQFGQLYRLLSPYDGKGTCSLMESEDQKLYYLFFIQGLTKPNQASLTLPLHYLSEGTYSASEVSFGEKNKGASPLVEIAYPSDFLNHFGYTFTPQTFDFEARLIVFTKQ
jgi:alpha-galactosidase